MTATEHGFTFEQRFFRNETTVYCKCGWSHVAPSLHAAHALSVEHIKTPPANEKDES